MKFSVLAGFRWHRLDAQVDLLLKMLPSKYVIVGGAAIAAHVGAHVREVSPDIDILMAPKLVRETSEKLKKAGFVEAPNVFGRSFKIEGLDVDLLEAKSKLEKWMVDNPVKIGHGEYQVNVAQPEALFIGKVLVARPKDLVDAKLLMEKFPTLATSVYALFDKIDAANRDDVGSAIAEIQFSLSK